MLLVLLIPYNTSSVGTNLAGGGGEEAGRGRRRPDGEDPEGLQDGVRAAVQAEAPQHHRPRRRHHPPGHLRDAVLQPGQPHGPPGRPKVCLISHRVCAQVTATPQL